VLDHLWELGGFGLQIPQEYGGLELTNTQYGRLAEIIGKFSAVQFLAIFNLSFNFF
jgi:alkylation response protein AidB-like acyl-CoA dehydrogenase